MGHVLTSHSLAFALVNLFISLSIIARLFNCLKLVKTLYFYDNYLTVVVKASRRNETANHIFTWLLQSLTFIVFIRISLLFVVFFFFCIPVCLMVHIHNKISSILTYIHREKEIHIATKEIAFFVSMLFTHYVCISIYFDLQTICTCYCSFFVRLVPYSFRLCASTTSSNETSVWRSQLDTKPFFFSLHFAFYVI